MNKEFQREQRYIVIKYDDLKYLNNTDRVDLDYILQVIEVGRR